MNRPRIVRVELVEKESPIAKSLFFKDHEAESALPGQFLMIWILGFDELPMSVSLPVDGCVGITVKMSSRVVQGLNDLRVGDKIGVRGPYGRPLKPVGKRALLVAGGTGIPPLALFCKRYVRMFEKLTLILGARTKDELMLDKKIRGILGGRGQVLVSTDDGSAGFSGSAPKLAKKLLGENSYDSIYVCGPELMIKKIYDLGVESGIPVQASLERIMKCGVGICGSCCIGKYLVCRDGPVFEAQRIKELEDELGVGRRDASGILVPI